jgi:hypothetical protein
VIGETRLISSGHRAVERATARFQVNAGDVSYRGGQRARQCGVRIAQDDHRVGALGCQHRLEPLQDARRLHRLRRRSHIQPIIRAGRRNSSKKIASIAKL